MQSEIWPIGWPVESGWTSLLQAELLKPSMRELSTFIANERKQHDVFPPAQDVFRAFALTEPDSARVIILGQDPYHGPGQANGLSFSVAPEIKIPPSLRNIFREMGDDLGCDPPGDGDLTFWAEQGVLLLNTVLTVRSAEAHSHRKRGWELFTDAVIQLLGQRSQPTAFVLWGKPAASKKKWIDESTHLVIESPHPSPLSASRGFFGSKPFSKINFFLSRNRIAPVQWTR